MPTGVQKYMIIDGQQRMTTLSLLMIALRDYLLEQGASEEVGKKITNKVLKNDAYDDEEAYKMLLTESDREIMIKLIDRLPINENETSKIYDNYIFFKQKVEEGVYGKSITDPCLGWEKTEKLILEIAELRKTNK